MQKWIGNRILPFLNDVELRKLLHAPQLFHAFFKKAKISNILTLAHVGGVGATPPLRFFLATRRTVSDSWLKFSVPSGASFAQLLVFFVKVMSGHGV